MLIPTHKITDHAESGISIRRLTPDIVMPADRPLHRDEMCQGMSVRSHRRSQRITDLLLIPVSIASVITGFGLHVAGKDSPHEVWEQWAAAHVVASVLFLVLGIYHVWHHWAWYKSLFGNGLANKSRVTLLLTIAFLFLSVTGIVLIVAIDGPNSTTGHLH